MVGLFLSAIMAVSVTIAPAGGSSNLPQWASAPSADLASVVGSWAKEAGLPTPEIDPKIGQYQVGGLKLQAADACAAIGKLVASLQYAEPQPKLAPCDGKSAIKVTAGA